MRRVVAPGARVSGAVDAGGTARPPADGTATEQRPPAGRAGGPWLSIRDREQTECAVVDVSDFQGTVTIASGADWLHGAHPCRVVFAPSGAIDGVVVTVRPTPFDGPLRALADGGTLPPPGRVQGRSDSAAPFDADLGAARKLTTHVDSVGVCTAEIHFEANYFSVGTLPPDTPTGATWVFRVPYLPLRFGTTPSGSGGGNETPQARVGGWALDTTPLAAFGRSWRLKSGVGPRAETGVPPISELATDAAANEGVPQVEDAVRPLLALMGLGCGRVLVRTSLELRVGSVTRWMNLPGTWAPRSVPQGVPHLRASDPRELQRFVEDAAPEFAKDAAWWETTASLFLQCGLNPFVEMKLAVLVVLLERIGNRVAKRRSKGQLGENFRRAADSGELRAELHECMTRVLPEWGGDQTKALVDELSRWDRNLSYAKAILSACRELRVPTPSAATLQLRHRLLHGFDHRATPRELDDAWVRLDDLAAMLLFRMLGFTGRIFLATEGREVSMDHLTAEGSAS